jgi:hypothetical protein
MQFAAAQPRNVYGQTPTATLLMDANGAWRLARVAKQESTSRPSQASTLRALAKMDAYLARIDKILAAPKGKRSPWVGKQRGHVADAAANVREEYEEYEDAENVGDSTTEADSAAQAQVQSCYDAARTVSLCAQRGLLMHYIASDDDPRAQEQAFETNMELFGPSLGMLRGGEDRAADAENPNAALDAVEAVLEKDVNGIDAGLIKEFEVDLREALSSTFMHPDAGALVGGSGDGDLDAHGEAEQQFIDQSVRELYGDFSEAHGDTQWKLDVANNYKTH